MAIKKEDRLLEVIKNGNLQMPVFLAEHYHELGINNSEFLVLVQLFAFAQKGNYFPSLSILSTQLHIEQREVEKNLSNLLTKKVIALNANNTEIDLSPIYSANLKEVVINNDKVGDSRKEILN
ncbi:MAG: helix-turn-helix domain-containing protein, partial [Lactobacillaceae bacterium]|nr:helix-turn-helix domain-containing protein [Lactobacillaceae bacterium]